MFGGNEEAGGSGDSGEIPSGWCDARRCLKEVSFMLSLEGWTKNSGN